MLMTRKFKNLDGISTITFKLRSTLLMMVLKSLLSKKKIPFMKYVIQK